MKDSVDGSQSALPLVTVGMPTYNRLERLKNALIQIRRQTYPRLRIMVYDNASPDPAIREFVEGVARDDPRVVYHRQATNVGWVANFQQVLRAADSEFFMWAADDDQYDPRFVAVCMEAHLSNPDLGLSFTRFERVDARGRKDREVVDTTTYNGRPGWPMVRRVIAEAEAHGRANLFYGVWKRSLALELMDIPFPWHRFSGMDVAFIAAALFRGEFHADERTLFRKGNIGPECGDEVRFLQMDFSRPEPWDFARFHRNPIALHGYYLALRGTPFLPVGWLLLGFRFVWEISRELRSGFRKVVRKLGMRRD
jgi:glycosyltransferase involved in cell wall biosynthesis